MAVIGVSDTPTWRRSTSPDEEHAARRQWSAAGGAERQALITDDDPAPIRVLVVDDEPDVERLFRMRFRKDIREGGFELRFASDGKQAIEAIEADPNLDVVVTDLNMPVMDGLALLAVIDEMKLPVKTIVLSAYGDLRTVRMAMMRGAFDFQVKPLDVDELRSTIGKAVASVRELQAAGQASSTHPLEDLFGNYVSDEVVTQLLSADGRPELTGERRTLTVLVAEMRDYARLSEQLAPGEALATVNRYLETACQVIIDRRGLISEIMGDGLMAMFGAPVSDPSAAANALAAAIELQLAMDDVNQEQRDRGLPELAQGIGIHTGPAIVGTIGSSRRIMKYAAIGSSVSIAARLAVKTGAGQILGSEETIAAAGGLTEDAGTVEIPASGATQPIRAVDVRGLGGAYRLTLEREGTSGPTG